MTPTGKAPIHHLRPPQVVNIRERVRNIFKSNRDVNGRPLPLAVNEVRESYIKQHGVPCRRIGAHIDAIYSDGQITRPNTGIYVWNDSAPAPRRVARLIAPENLPPRHKVAVNEPYCLNTAAVQNLVYQKHQLLVPSRVISALASAKLIPSEGSKKFKYPPRVVNQIASMVLACEGVDNVRKPLVGAVRKGPKRAPR